jgi:hypothetical protein
VGTAILKIKKWRSDAMAFDVAVKFAIKIVSEYIYAPATGELAHHYPRETKWDS